MVMCKRRKRKRPAIPSLSADRSIGVSCPPQLLGGHVNTIPEQAVGTRRRRRTHSDEFKANLVASCMQAGMSMAAVAMAHGINANLLRRWVREAEMGRGAVALQPQAASQAPAKTTAAAFVPMQLPGKRTVIPS